MYEKCSLQVVASDLLVSRVVRVWRTVRAPLHGQLTTATNGQRQPLFNHFRGGRCRRVAGGGHSLTNTQSADTGHKRAASSPSHRTNGYI